MPLHICCHVAALRIDLHAGDTGGAERGFYEFCGDALAAQLSGNMGVGECPNVTLVNVVNDPGMSLDLDRKAMLIGIMGSG